MGKQELDNLVEGRTEVGEKLFGELIRHTVELQKIVAALNPPAR